MDSIPDNPNIPEVKASELSNPEPIEVIAETTSVSTELVSDDEDAKLHNLYTKEQIDAAIAEAQKNYNYKICGNVRLSEDGKTLSICRIRATGGGNGLANNCRWHGTGNKKARVKKELFSENLSKYATLQDLYASFNEDKTQIKDLSNEINLLRSIMTTKMQELKELTPDDNDEARRKQNSVVNQILNVLDQLRKLISTQQSVDESQKYAITWESLNAFCWAVQKVIEQEVESKQTQAKVFSRIATEVRLVIAKS